MFFKTDYRQKINEALQQDRKDLAAQYVEEAFQSSQDEDLLAWCAGVAYEFKIPGTEWAIAQFVERFPHSLHLIRIFLAEMEVNQGRFDAGSNEARIHLRQLFDSGWHEQEPENPFVSRAIGQGFLLLTAVYTHLGARSYSLRVLNFAQKWLHSDWFKKYDEEKALLNSELKEPEHRSLDERWEAFFVSGSENMQELLELASSQGAQAIAKRIELLEGKFRFDTTGTFKIDEQEILMLILKSGETYTLN